MAKMVSVRSLVAVLYATILFLFLSIVYLTLSGVPGESSYAHNPLMETVIVDGRQMKAERKYPTLRVFTTCSENFTQYVDKRRENMTIDNTTNPYLIPRQTKVNPYNFSFLIDGRTICQQEAPFLLIVVPSVFDHQKEREIIRESWGSVVKTGRWADGTELPVIKLVFLFGMRNNSSAFSILKNESVEYGDAVLADFVDSYRNLTIKSITALYWTIRFCPDAEYLLKNDEDTIINLPWLINVLKRSSTDIVLGRRRRAPTVFRAGSRKWSVRKQEYPLDRYPPYIFGNYYVIPNNLIGKLFYLSEYIPYLSMEDVFITGIIRQAAGVSIKSLARWTCTNLHCKNVNQIAYVVGVANISKQWENFRRPTNQISRSESSRWK